MFGKIEKIPKYAKFFGRFKRLKEFVKKVVVDCVFVHSVAFYIAAFDWNVQFYILDKNFFDIRTFCCDL